MRVKKIFGSILAGVLIVSGVSMSANAADIAPKTLELESVDYYMAVRANGGVDLSTEEKQIHTNAAGETYGEALVVKYLNEDVDMISAIGKNGTEGYSELLGNKLPSFLLQPPLLSNTKRITKSYTMSTSVRLG